MQSGGMTNDRKVGEGADDMVAEPAEIAAGGAGRVVFDGSAFDVGEVFRDGGAGDGDAEFDGSADGVGNK